MDVIKCADYVIDLGPEGGDKGGNIVAVGTPEEVAACGVSGLCGKLHRAVPERKAEISQESEMES
mgnify:CR=1 FL=1